VGSRSGRQATRTYAASGVDVGARASALSALLRAAEYAAPASHGRPVPGASGHFAGLVRIAGTTIAITTDTVGTKVLLAERLRRWEEVGEDLVASNVNDLAAVGARTVGLVDTIVCARADASRFRALGRGIRRGLAAARCSLLGGETALVGDLVHGIDLGGTAIGYFPGGRRPVLGSGIRAGDLILGIPSSGFHANGYTLIRRVLEEHRVDLRRPRPGGRVPVGVELLRPTRTYTEAADGLAGVPGVRGLAHLSGGGVRNLARLRPDRRFVLDRWPEPPGLFGWLQRTGGLDDREVFQTFNMGIGFAAVVAPSAIGAARRVLRARGAGDALEIGRVERGAGVDVPRWGLRFEGYA
jgi:phosphoribosylformylglycinamidine cyclo-ligase